MKALFCCTMQNNTIQSINAMCIIRNITFMQTNLKYFIISNSSVKCQCQCCVGVSVGSVVVLWLRVSGRVRASRASQEAGRPQSPAGCRLESEVKRSHQRAGAGELGSEDISQLVILYNCECQDRKHGGHSQMLHNRQHYSAASSDCVMSELWARYVCMQLCRSSSQLCSCIAGGKSRVTADFCCISGQTLLPLPLPPPFPHSDQSKQQLGWYGLRLGPSYLLAFMFYYPRSI